MSEQNNKINQPINNHIDDCVQDSLAEVEERYRKAMVSNAQLHNEKTTLMYQVETLKEELSDMEELLWESRRHCDHSNKVGGHTGVSYIYHEFDNSKN